MTMISTPVMVFCRKQENQSEFAWAQFSPLGKSYERIQEVRVYLINPGNHYNRVISVLPAVPREESCNNDKKLKPVRQIITIILTTIKLNC